MIIREIEFVQEIEVREIEVREIEIREIEIWDIKVREIEFGILICNRYILTSSCQVHSIPPAILYFYCATLVSLLSMKNIGEQSKRGCASTRPSKKGTLIFLEAVVSPYPTNEPLVTVNNVKSG